jgi:hypothetical protein
MTALAYFFTRIYDAMIKARARQAEIEIRRHTNLVPNGVRFKATYTSAKKLPFIK